MASVEGVQGVLREAQVHPGVGHSQDLREKKRRRRTRPHEVDILMSAYLQNAFPNEKTRERLAQSVNMTPRAVSIWFQNRRQAEKKRSQRYGATSPHALGMRVPVTEVPPNAAAPVHRDLAKLVGPLPHAAQRQGTMQRAKSSPCISLTTNAHGHAQLGPIEEQKDCAIWQRMESSSAWSGSSDLDEPSPDRSHDEDEDEMTLRRLAQRRNERVRKREAPDASDARQMIQERASTRRTHAPATRGLKRQASLSLEFAAARETSPPESKTALRRTESMPVRAPLQPIQAPAAPPPAMRRPRLGAENVPPVRGLHPLRRATSASAHMPLRAEPHAYWPRAAPIPVTRRESSARSDALPAPAKSEEHDDSGFFDESSQSTIDVHSSPESAKHAMPNFTENDRQAVELLLGLGIVSSRRT